MYFKNGKVECLIYFFKAKIQELNQIFNKYYAFESQSKVRRKWYIGSILPYEYVGEKNHQSHSS